MASTSKRSLYFDNAKLILIFLVVFGHVISPLKGNDDLLFTLYTVIFLFHMPAFILISGYFAKGYRKKGYLLKSVKKILLPYLIFQAIYSFFYFINGDEKSLTFDFLQPHWTLWFLLSLFCWNVLIYAFAKLKWIGLIVAVAIGIAIGYVDQVGNYLSLSRTFVFFPYFLLGFLIEQKHINWIKNMKFSAVIGVLIILSTFLLFGLSFPKDAVPWLLGSSSYADMGNVEWFDGLFRMLQYLLTLVVIFGFFALVPATGSKLTIIGQRTLYIYLLHGFIIKIIETAVSDETLESISQNYLLLFIFSFALCLILGSYLIKKYTKPLIELRL
ncbi:acyltransferase family protein [Heyndrickxia sporothermodurans]|uniref:acyltransferase family protein n=1 Tax=Heyndrickxia sporothermodurans TaxID=46224 RepID=UPI002E1AD603|nr:acyltransferase family protein [Heyndrickxia sporothermodurans]MED3655912.1 acyltransferase family protein [Heyndrickxia sporothermodurans]